MTFRTVFFGTPEFAVPSLVALHERTQVVGVVCQPDRHAGRGMKLQAPAVKRTALGLGLEVHQPTRVRDGGLEAWLREKRADAAIVAAYGRILPAGVLRAPRLGCLNLHASILPAYRGAAPIQWCVLDGCEQTGISLMHMDEGMDTGPVYAVRSLSIPAEMNAGELTRALAELAADVVGHELVAALRGELGAVPQDHARATSAPPITREQARIDWTRGAVELTNQVRAFAPAPGAFTFSGAKRLKLLEVRPGREAANALPGTVLLGAAGLEIACGRGTIDVRLAQLEGRTVQSARELLNGRVLEPGQRLGGAEAP